jgi:hypothetical protein
MVAFEVKIHTATSTGAKRKSSASPVETLEFMHIDGPLKGVIGALQLHPSWNPTDQLTAISLGYRRGLTANCLLRGIIAMECIESEPALDSDGAIDDMHRRYDCLLLKWSKSGKRSAFSGVLDPSGIRYLELKKPMERIEIWDFDDQEKPKIPGLERTFPPPVRALVDSVDSWVLEVFIAPRKRMLLPQVCHNFKLPSSYNSLF